MAIFLHILFSGILGTLVPVVQLMPNDPNVLVSLLAMSEPASEPAAKDRVVELLLRAHIASHACAEGLLAHALMQVRKMRSKGRVMSLSVERSDREER